MGAFIADAMGSYLEFNSNIATEKEMDECMKMPGGGPFYLATGHFTDDSELAMCLMQGIVNSNKQSRGILVGDEIAKMYLEWMCSDPFDMGFTTRNALQGLKYDPRWTTAKEAAFYNNKKSLSNGGLMRMTPLAVWASNISDPTQHFTVVETD